LIVEKRKSYQIYSPTSELIAEAMEGLGRVIPRGNLDYIEGLFKEIPKRLSKKILLNEYHKWIKEKIKCILEYRTQEKNYDLEERKRIVWQYQEMIIQQNEMLKEKEIAKIIILAVYLMDDLTHKIRQFERGTMTHSMYYKKWIQAEMERILDWNLTVVFDVSKVKELVMSKVNNRFTWIMDEIVEDGCCKLTSKRGIRKY
jgi:hypothetical protein